MKPTLRIPVTRSADPPPTTLVAIATHCGRPVAALKTIQKSFALHIPADGAYSEAYCRFLEKIVALHALHVSRTALLEIFEKEKQILRLLHVDMRVRVMPRECFMITDARE
jgi:hypothetical protein